MKTIRPDRLGCPRTAPRGDFTTLRRERGAWRHTAKVMKGIERREPPTDVERAAREINERGRSITRILPRPLQPRGPERDGGGFER